MCNGLIGKKLGMTGIFTPNGEYVPVTVVQLGPCVITQVKTEATDGYNALQLGFEEKKASRVNKPLKGHLRKSGEKCFAVLKEVRTENPDQYSLGQTLAPSDCFQVGEKVDVTGKSKGRGFSGVIKRHGFHRGPETHGSMNHRAPGSVGCSAWPSRVIKGKKLPGQYGNEQKTIKNLEIIDILPEEHLVLVKGALPGPVSGLVMVKKRKGGKKA
jgi:large subunit ribosomal protein L3